MNASTEYKENKPLPIHDRVQALLKTSANTKGLPPKQHNPVTLDLRSWNEVLRRSTALPGSVLSICEVRPGIERTWSGSKIQARQKILTSSPNSGKRKTSLQLTYEPCSGDSVYVCQVYETPEQRSSNYVQFQVEEISRRKGVEHYTNVKSSLAKDSKSDFPRRFSDPKNDCSKFLDKYQQKSQEKDQNSDVADESDQLGSDLRTVRWCGNGSPKRRILFRRPAACEMSHDKKASSKAAAGYSHGKMSEKLSNDGSQGKDPEWAINGKPPSTQRQNPELTNLNSVDNQETSQDRDSPECSPKKSFAKRLSKVIEVDGVNYMVTMEPPGSSVRRASRASKTALVSPAPVQCAPVVEVKPPPVDMNGVEKEKVADTKIQPSSGIAARELDAWYCQRQKRSSNIDLNRCGDSEVVDPVTNESLDHAALRLRKVVQSLNAGSSIKPEVLRQNLEYAVSVMESSFLKVNSRLEPQTSSDDEMLDNLSGEVPVPQEIKSWLVQTFSNTRVGGHKKRTTDRRSLRSVVHAVQAGMFVDRIFRKFPTDAANNVPPDVKEHLKNLDSWTFDVFELERISTGNSLKFVFYQLLMKYDLIRKFKIPVPSLFAYCNRLQRGYRKHNNRYHNPIHAADVAQALNCLLVESGFINWLSDLEMFSMIMAAIIHDLEHTGTTNNFHTNTRSPLALLYNDKSVLENHHVSTAFRMLQEEGCDIMCNFPKDDYQECRALMIEMVLATDMSQHFSQIKRIKSSLQQPETLEKSKAMCLMIHSADINHPAKPWELHYKWTERLVVEFFVQGDRERELGLPLSPLCDRRSTMVAQSQIGFIDYVIQPTFGVLFDMFAQVNGPVIRDFITAMAKEASKSSQPPSQRGSVADDVLKRRFSDVTTFSTAFQDQAGILKKLADFKETCTLCTGHNRKQWMKKDEIERANVLLGEDAFTAAAAIVPDPPPSRIYDKSLTNGNDEQTNLISTENAPSRTLNNNDNSKPP